MAAEVKHGIWVVAAPRATTGLLPYPTGSIWKQMRAQLLCSHAKYNFGFRLQWLEDERCGANEDKIQLFKLCGGVSTDLGSFVFCCDMVERLGRWQHVEGRGRLRLEARVAVSKSPLREPCADLDQALIRTAELLAFACNRDANGLPPEEEEDYWMPPWMNHMLEDKEEDLLLLSSK